METKPIPFAPNYEISKDGTITSYQVAPEGRLIKQNVRSDGQHQVTLMINGAKKSTLVKRAVAITYLGAKEDDQVHRHGDVSDDNVDNLYIMEG